MKRSNRCSKSRRIVRNSSAFRVNLEYLFMVSWEALIVWHNPEDSGDPNPNIQDLILKSRDSFSKRVFNSEK
jgi:hypothetical protein